MLPARSSLAAARLQIPAAKHRQVIVGKDGKILLAVRLDQQEWVASLDAVERGVDHKSPTFLCVFRIGSTADCPGSATLIMPTPHAVADREVVQGHLLVDFD